MDFDPLAPFPKTNPEEVSYEEVKAHSRAVDFWLGFNLEAVEAEIRVGPALGIRDQGEYWLRKPVETFMTPYWDLDHMLREASIGGGDLVIDLGAGYARLLFVLALRYPGVSFIGVEKIEARLVEARRVLCENSLFCDLPADSYLLLAADLQDVEIANLPHPSFSNLSSSTVQTSSPFSPVVRGQSQVADRTRTHFFIYDFGSRQDIQTTLVQLQRLALKQEIVVIARGGRSREIIERNHSWLCRVHAPRHFSRFSIYRS